MEVQMNTKWLVRFLFVTFMILIFASADRSDTITKAQAQGQGPQPVGLRPDAPAFAKHGPYWVGTREYVIPDTEGQRPLPLTIWYPALNPDGKAEDITYTAE